MLRLISVALVATATVTTMGADSEPARIRKGAQDFIRVGQGCCRSFIPELSQNVRQDVTSQIEGGMTRGKCRRMCENAVAEGRIVTVPEVIDGGGQIEFPEPFPCFGFEVDTSDNHPKCELHFFPVGEETEPESPGCTFSTISCWAYLEFIDPDDGCIAADNTVQERTAGAIRAAEVKPGDMVRGISGDDQQERWCTVLSNNDMGNGMVQNGFTPNHFILSEDGKSVLTSAMAAVGTAKGLSLNLDVPYDSVRSAVNSSKARLNNIMTDCEAVLTEDGIPFTPFSTTFCDIQNMTWSQYRSLYRAVMAVVFPADHDSNLEFLFDSRTFHNNGTSQYGSTWQAVLPGICDSLLKCAEDADRDACEELDIQVHAFADSNMDDEHGSIVLEAMPISATVAGVGKSRLSAGEIAAIAVCSVLVLGAVAAVVARLRRKPAVSKDTDSALQVVWDAPADIPTMVADQP